MDTHSDSDSKSESCHAQQHGQRERKAEPSTFPIKGIIFDLDETLLTANLNFAEIRAAIGCPKNQDILTYVAQLAEPERGQANATILAHELRDAQQATWIAGAQEVVETLQAQQRPLAIVTRNSRQAVAIKLAQNQVPIATVVTRDEAPAKPDPTALLAIAAEWQIPPGQIAYVGDFLYDVLAANRAEMHACLYLRRGREDCAQYLHRADFVFDDYRALLDYVQTGSPGSA